MTTTNNTHRQRPLDTRVHLRPGDRSPARAPDRVDLVDEDDRGGCGLRLREEVAYPRRADADDHLDELRGRHREERDARLAGNGSRQQRLAGSRRPGQEDASRDARPEPAVLARLAEEVDDLGQLLLGLVDSRHVLERDALLRRLVLPRLRFAHREHAAARAPVAADQPDPQPDEQQCRPDAVHQGLPPRGPDRLRLDHDPVVPQQLIKTVRVRERRHLGLEPGRRVGVLVRRRVTHGALERPLDIACLRADRRDVPAADLLEEGRVVGNRDPRCAAYEGRREDEVEHEQPKEERHGPPVQPPFVVAVPRCVEVGSVASCRIRLRHRIPPEPSVATSTALMV
jgi:hypothetical protein